ncbi:MAG: nitroreductase family protein [Planctomycetaceae bacterium]|nr:nitroreductase family protein [Planctomycetaceae bacterium]
MFDMTSIIATVIHNRQTEKVLADEPIPSSAETLLTDEILELAAWAPFHRPADESHRKQLDAPMPWRFYVLDSEGCRQLRRELLSRDSSRIIQMLATADCLIQATWLPNPGDDPGQLFDPTMENMEHLAAASAAVQTLLLAATAHGIRNYWSSGGVLRSPEVYARMGIPKQEILLGSLFFFPQEVGTATIATSKLRDQRGPLSGWVRRVQLNTQTE